MKNVYLCPTQFQRVFTSNYCIVPYVLMEPISEGERVRVVRCFEAATVGDVLSCFRFVNKIQDIERITDDECICRLTLSIDSAIDLLSVKNSEGLSNKR